MSADPVNVEHALRRVAATLKAAGIERPRAEARLLLTQASGLDLAAQTRDPDRPLDVMALDALEALARRRVAREPMAYILGEKEFFGRSFSVGPGVLVPRPETELLVEKALERLGARGGGALRVLDLGTGSGCILASVLAESPCAWGVGVDVSEAALGYARVNLERHGLRERAALARGRWADAIACRFDLVVSNPPYVTSKEHRGLEPDVRDFEPSLALIGGQDGLAPYGALACELPRLLAPGGAALFECGAGQGDALRTIFGAGGRWSVEVLRDLNGFDRVALVRPRKP